MQRTFRLGTLALVLLAAACGVPDATAPVAADVERINSVASVEPGTCTNLAELNQLAAVLFTPQSSPSISSVRGKLRNLESHVKKGKIAQAEAAAGEIVAFTLLKHNQGGLAGTAADVEAFTNKVLCFAGIDIDVEEPTNSYFILPSDTAQIIRNIDGSAGINFPANPVTEPTLVQFAVIPDTYGGGGAGPLDTKLDQYPGFIQITKTSETDAPLAKPVVVAVCAQGVIPTDVRARLRLGHQALAGFEVTPQADGNFITCPVQTAEAGATPLWKRLASAMMPRLAHAQLFAGGGVGGTVTEFSPFAPVDPVLSFGGGVGGTVTEFTREAATTLLSGGLAALTGPCSAPIEGATGSPLREECRPYITLATRLGTPFVSVPVTWDVIQGGGTVAPNAAGACGTFGAVANNATGSTGRAGICWTLGAVGANQVRATPSLGGDAITGVVFSPASITFDAIANPPAGLAFTQQPPTVVQTDPAFTVQVTVVDKNGERVHVYNDRVRLTLDRGTFAGSVNGYTALNAVAGIADFSLAVATPGEDYTLTATAPFLPVTALPTVSTPFDVVPGAPYHIIALPAGTSAAVGTAVTPAPTVRVTDRYGNLLVGAPVRWAVMTDFGSVTPELTSTNAQGEATTTWILGAGFNRIDAFLAAGRPERVKFEATGTAP